MKRTIGILVLLAAIIGIAIGTYMYNKPHQNLALSKPDFSMTGQALFDAFSANEVQANESYVGKIIAVKGKVKNISRDGMLKITIETDDMLSGVICEMDNGAKESNLMVGNDIEIKGICTGMLMDVVLTKCQFVN